MNKNNIKRILDLLDTEDLRDDKYTKRGFYPPLCLLIADHFSKPHIQNHFWMYDGVKYSTFGVCEKVTGLCWINVNGSRHYLFGNPLEQWPIIYSSLYKTDPSKACAQILKDLLYDNFPRNVFTNLKEKCITHKEATGGKNGT